VRKSVGFSMSALGLPLAAALTLVSFRERHGWADPTSWPTTKERNVFTSPPRAAPSACSTDKAGT